MLRPPAGPLRSVISYDAAGMEPLSGDQSTASFQPALSLWGNTWRTLIIVAFSAVSVVGSYPALTEQGSWRVALDIALGVVAFALVFLRRRWPFPVALAVLAVAAVSAAAAGPAVLAIVSLATHRIWWQIVVVAITTVVSSTVFLQFMPTDNDQPLWVDMLLISGTTLASLGWGLYIGSRRELLWTLRQRAERAEAQRDLRLRKARSDERAAIAREMHDVLAHRISQISMYAGALAFRRDLDADQLRAGIGDVQERANDALADLRSVLGVLRDPDTGLVQHGPQPTYDDIDDLIDISRAGGARIDVENRITTRPVPTALGRTMYRIVQEGITNATKHAPGARLQVELSGGEDGVDVVIRNPLGPGANRVPGAELGLVGLRERVELAGGELEHERTGATFVLHASLPWVTK